MNYSIVFQVAVPTFILLVVGIGLTIKEFNREFNARVKKATRKKK